MPRRDRAYPLYMVLRRDTMRKHLPIIAALLLAAAVLGILAAAPMALSYS
jgi:hypothetical protein